MRILLLAFGAVLGASCAYLSSQYKHEQAVVKQVQDGELILTCFMLDGERAISGDMVTGYFEGSWQFKNGHSKTCEVAESEAVNL